MTRSRLVIPRSKGNNPSKFMRYTCVIIMHETCMVISAKSNLEAVLAPVAQ